MLELIKKNRFYYITILFFLLLGGIVLLVTTKSSVSLWVNAHYSLILDAFFRTYNSLGDITFTVALVVVIGVMKDWKLAWKSAACFISVSIVTQVAKHVLFPGTLRPTLYFEEGILRLLEGVIQLETESFPSGHTSAAFSIATFLALYWSNKKWNFIFAFLALTIGYGRIYMSQHFITDVYVGMIIGVVVTTLVYYLYPEDWLEKHETKN